MRLSGVPFDPARQTHGQITPTCGVLHRTYGAWAGDYSVGKNNPGGVGFHALIGKGQGQQVQLADTRAKCWHAGGWPNNDGIGLEFTGRNDEPLTDWQVMAGANVLKQLRDVEKIPLLYYHGPRIGAGFRGWLTHASVRGSNHTDMVTRADWDRMMGIIAASDRQAIDWMALRRLAAAQCAETLRKLGTVKPGSPALAAIVVQRALNLIADRRLVEDGVYGDDVIRAVVDFQRFFGIKDQFPGVVGDATRFFMVLLLDRIAKGE